MLKKNLQEKFKSFLSVKVAAYLATQGFDIQDFDERGHKSFTKENSTYEIGPKNKKEKYVQPHGWTRFGLKVLDGRYGNDHTWLEPFNHDNNWYRAFHGTNPDVGKQILTEGLKPGLRQAYQGEVGIGVYCTPNPKEAEIYCKHIDLPTKKGTIRYKLMYQLAVDPNKIKKCSRKEYWVLPEKELKNNSYRIYGILLKEEKL